MNDNKFTLLFYDNINEIIFQFTFTEMSNHNEFIFLNIMNVGWRSKNVKNCKNLLGEFEFTSLRETFRRFSVFS